MANSFESDLGKVTAYAYAVDAGYQGTEAEFEEDLLNAVSTFETDKTLAVEDKAADAKATGDIIADLDEAISLLNAGTSQVNVEYVQGFWNSTTNINTSNATLICNKKPIYLPAGSQLEYNTALYVLPHWINGNNLSAVNVVDSTGTVQSGKYVTGMCKVTPVNYDRKIVMRIGKDDTHSENIVPAEADLSMTMVRPDAMGCMVSIKGQINVGYASGVWTFTPSNDFVGILKNGNKFATNIPSATFEIDATGTTLIYYDESDGRLHSAKVGNNNWTNFSNINAVAYIYSSKLITLKTRIVIQERYRYNSQSNIGGLIAGNIWMFVANGKLHIITDSRARAVFNENYIDITNVDASYTVSATRYVVIDNNGFSVKAPAELIQNEIIVAIVYNKAVIALSSIIFANELPITGLIQREGIPIFINNKRIYGYEVKSRNTTYMQDFGYWYRLINAFNYASSPIAYKEPTSWKAIPAPDSAKVAKNITDISGKKVLTIGDSVTRRGWYQQRIIDDGAGCTFVGTQESYYNAISCEGYSGRKASEVLGSSKINVNGQQITNPFWDASSNRCDLAYFCTHTGIEPDIVVIEFGLNETDADDYYSYIAQFIETIKEYNSSIKVYVVQPFAESDSGANNHTGSAQRTAIHTCLLNSYDFEATLIPAWFIMIDDYDYEHKTVQYEYGEVNVIVEEDGVHPAENTGFAKLGDMIYNYLGA